MRKFQRIEMARTRPTKAERLDISRETLNEIQGIVILFLALACILSILSINRPSNLIGPVGEHLARFLILALGQVVAYFVPATLFIWGITRFRGIPWPHAFLKIFGLALIIAAGCGLLYQVGNDMARYVESQAERDYVCFRWGGAVGGFIISPEGLNLPRWLGRTGTYLLLGSTLAVGVLLATNFLFYRFFTETWSRIRYGHNAVSRRVARLTKKIKERQKQRSPRFRRRETTRVLGAAIAEEPPDEVSPPKKRSAVVEKKPTEAETFEVAPFADNDAAALREPETPEPSASLAGYSPSEQLDLFAGYQVPPLDLLSPPPPSNAALTEKEIAFLSHTIEEKLRSFGIEVHVTNVTEGPVVTLFELRPAPGVKINKIVTLENDLAMALRASRLRILAPIPGRGTVGIEIPNRKPNIVCLREILESPEFQRHKAPLMFGLGKTIDGRPYVCNLAKMPHLLIAGATGSGKSVCLNAIICSLLLRNPPDRVRFILIDPKRVEMSVFRGIPHLLAPVVSEPRKCAAALAWVVGQMEERYKQLAKLGLREIDAYNRLALDRAQALAKYGRELPYMPHIVIIVDELADLMLVARNEVEENVIRLAQMSRAVGIHLIIATQRPSVNVITGIIKANFPSRIAFQVSSKVDSRTILDTNGAEALLGRGDMLFSPSGSMRPVRLQGAFVSDAEVERLVEFITSQGEAMTEEQLEAERAIESVEEKSAAEARRAALASPLESEISPGEGPPPRSIDDVERVLGHERDQRPVRVKYEVEDFTEPLPELDDDLYEPALRLILESRKASVSLIQRRLKIGYARAGRLMDLMEDRGIVGPYQGSKPREILVDPDEYLKKLDEEKAKRNEWR